MDIDFCLYRNGPTGLSLFARLSSARACVACIWHRQSIDFLVVVTLRCQRAQNNRLTDFVLAFSLHGFTAYKIETNYMAEIDRRAPACHATARFPRYCSAWLLTSSKQSSASLQCHSIAALLPWRVNTVLAPCTAVPFTPAFMLARIDVVTQHMPPFQRCCLGGSALLCSMHIHSQRYCLGGSTLFCSMHCSR